MVSLTGHVDHTNCIRRNTPTELKALPQWVVWRFETIKDRQTKVLYNPNQPLAKAKCNDPATWGTFEQALEAFHGNYSRFDGVAFAFTADDPYAGIDLDDCIDPATEEFLWGKSIIDRFASYTEISPSGCGVKIFIKGTKPEHAGCHVKDKAVVANGAMEVYDKGRFFVVTGERLPDSPKHIVDAQDELTKMCDYFWPKQPASVDRPTIDRQPARSDNRFNRCLTAMLRMNITDHNDGSHRLIAACCRCVEHDLSDHEAIACLRAYQVQYPFPVPYSDTDLLKRLRDAEKKTQRGKALNEPGRPDSIGGLPDVDNESIDPQYRSIQAMLQTYPDMRQSVINGLLRQGETMNIIAAPKTGKSWLVNDMAMAVATGRKWLDTYETQQGKVLILDNELHSETSASRIPKVAEARGIDLSEVAETLYIDNLRGRLVDIYQLEHYFNQIEPGQFKVIVLDAFYRFMPAETDENDNGGMSRIYNQIDRYAAQLECAFVLIHHTTKGSQSAKSVTDVGAGAGAQSRATDSHLVLRQHQEKDVIVLDAAVRSWPPIKPICLRWDMPVWNPAPELDPNDLDSPFLRRKKAKAEKPAEPQWTPEQFVEQFITESPQTKDQIIHKAKEAGLSQSKAKRLLSVAENMDVYRWTYGANKKVQFSTIQQPDELKK